MSSNTTQNTFKIDFAHPWCSWLYAAQVPQKKWDEFYEQFGTVMHSVSTPESVKSAAFMWIHKNGKVSLYEKDPEKIKENVDAILSELENEK
jgi:hypothetical protein